MNQLPADLREQLADLDAEDIMLSRKIDALRAEIDAIADRRRTLKEEAEVMQQRINKEREKQSLLAEIKNETRNTEEQENTNEMATFGGASTLRQLYPIWAALKHLR